MKYFEDYGSKFGFGDGDSLPPDAEAHWVENQRVLNALLEKHGSGVRTVCWFRHGMHNPFLLLRVPAELFGTFGTVFQNGRGCEGLPELAGQWTEAEPDEGWHAALGEGLCLHADGYSFVDTAVELDEEGLRIFCEALRNGAKPDEAYAAACGPDDAGYRLLPVPGGFNVRVPAVDEAVWVRADIHRPQGSDAPCFQLLAYAAGELEPTVAVRFGDDGAVEEVAVEGEARVLRAGEPSDWLRRRDGPPDRHGTLVIGNVDLGLLEEQRLALMRVIDCAVHGHRASEEDAVAVCGIQEMLDAWSDGRLPPGGGEP